jgi:hypothetical protein
MCDCRRNLCAERALECGSEATAFLPKFQGGSFAAALHGASALLEFYIWNMDHGRRRPDHSWWDLNAVEGGAWLTTSQ